MEKHLETNARRFARELLRINAIKLRPDNPFQWASGWRSPIYNDNRMTLYFPELRELIIDAFKDILWSINLNLFEELRGTDLIIAGTSTAGIPHAYGLAESLSLPFIYVRDKPKDHGMRNQIEGIDTDKDLDGRKVVLIEDLISTGGSSVNAVQAIRDANGEIDCCLSIFNYGFPKAEAMFAGKVSYTKDDSKKLEYKCDTHSILDYPTLLQVAITEGYINEEQIELLNKWSHDPEAWSNTWKAEHEKTVV